MNGIVCTRCGFPLNSDVDLGARRGDDQANDLDRFDYSDPPAPPRPEKKLVPDEPRLDGNQAEPLPREPRPNARDRVEGMVTRIERIEEPVARGHRGMLGDEAVAAAIRNGVLIGYWIAVLVVGWLVLEYLLAVIIQVLAPLILAAVLIVFLLAVLMKMLGGGRGHGALELFEAWLILRPLWGLIMVPFRMVASLGRELSLEAERSYRRLIQNRLRSLPVHWIFLAPIPGYPRAASSAGAVSMRGIWQGSPIAAGDLVRLTGTHDGKQFVAQQGEVVELRAEGLVSASPPRRFSVRMPPGLGKKA